jgi:hypothetical protein
VPPDTDAGETNIQMRRMASFDLFESNFSQASFTQAPGYLAGSSAVIIARPWGKPIVLVLAVWVMRNSISGRGSRCPFVYASTKATQRTP